MKLTDVVEKIVDYIISGNNNTFLKDNLIKELSLFNEEKINNNYNYIIDNLYPLLFDSKNQEIAKTFFPQAIFTNNNAVDYIIREFGLTNLPSLSVDCLQDNMDLIMYKIDELIKEGSIEPVQTFLKNQVNLEQSIKHNISDKINEYEELEEEKQKATNSIEKGNYSSLNNYPLEAFTSRSIEKVYNNHLIEKKSLPNSLKNSIDLLILAINNNDLDTILFINPDLIFQNILLLVNAISKGLYIGENILNFSDMIRNNYSFVSSLVKNEDLICLKYVNEDFIKKYPELILKGIELGAEISAYLNFPKEIINALINKGAMNSLHYISISSFDDYDIESIVNYFDELSTDVMPEFLNSPSNIPFSFRKDDRIVKSIFNFYHKIGLTNITHAKKKYDFLSILSPDILNTNFSHFLSLTKYIEEEDYYLKLPLNEENILSVINLYLSKEPPDDLLRNITPNISSVLDDLSIQKLISKVQDNTMRSPRVISMNSLDLDAIANNPILLKNARRVLSIHNIIANKDIIKTFSEQELINILGSTKISTSALHFYRENVRELKNFLIEIAKKDADLKYYLEKIGYISSPINDIFMSLMKKNDKYGISDFIENNGNNPIFLNMMLKHFPHLFYEYGVYFPEQSFNEENIALLNELVKTNPNLAVHERMIKHLNQEYVYSIEYIDDIFKKLAGLNKDALNSIPQEIFEKNSRYILDNLSIDMILRNEILIPRYLKENSEFVDNFCKYIEELINTKKLADYNSIDKYFDIIQQSKRLLKLVIENKFALTNYLFNQNLFDQELVNLIIDKIKSGEQISSSLLPLPEIVRSNKEIIKAVIENNSLYLFGIINKEFYYNNGVVFADAMGISEEEFIGKLKYLEGVNDEIFQTLNIGLLKSDFSKLNLDFLEKVSLYYDIQTLILDLTNNKIKKEVFIKLANHLMGNRDTIDVAQVTNLLLNNGFNNGQFEELFAHLNVEELTDEQIGNLILITSKENNNLRIISQNQLTNEAYQDQRKRRFTEIEELIKTDQIGLESLKEAIFERYLNIGTKEAEFIYHRYCFDLKALKESKEADSLDEIISYLEMISRIIETKDLEVLVSNYQKLEYQVEADYTSAYSMDILIRSKFIELYNQTFYKPKEEDKTKNLFLKNTQYNGKPIDVYETSTDFNMTIHALGAYREWTLPEDFADSWNRPKISFGGICTSYIGNDLIAPANVEHPILGFSEFEDSSLLLSGNYDLFSDIAIKKFSTSSAIPYTFLPPSLMKDCTRHNHNEMVFERRNLSKEKQGFKRMPNYVVYIVDNMNSKYFSDEETVLWKETKQAAADFSIPIVIIDKSKHISLEQEKIEKMNEEFSETLDPKLARKIITKLINNSVGGRFTMDKKINRVRTFSPATTRNYYEKIITIIDQLMDNKEIEKAQQLIGVMLEMQELENKNISVSHKSDKLEKTFDYEVEKEKLMSLFNKSKEIANKSGMELR